MRTEKQRYATLAETRVPGQPDHTVRRMLRAGRKGTGRLLWSLCYWPDSGKSCEAADLATDDAVERYRQMGWIVDEACTIPVD